MKATRTMAMAVGTALLAVGAAVAAPSVEITSVQQQYPWTNTVDIVYTVAGVESETNGYFVVFTPTTSDGKEILDVNGEKSVQVALKGSGVYSTQWFPQTNLQYTACKMTPSVFRGAAKDYMIVDLETGAVTYEPMATQEASNQRYQANEYKTRYLVLRRVEGGKSYYIGGPEDSSTIIGSGRNSYHAVSIPRDYYFAIYELTEAQYDRIVGESVPSNSMYPKGYLSYNTIRGSALPGAVPSSGLIASLNKKTGLVFDLPTVSMFEIASRAGCTTKFLSGDTQAGLDQYAWADGSNKPRVVGTIPKANNWGIYDTCCNMWECCRDAWNSQDLAAIQPDGLVTITDSESNGYCVFVGCGIDHNLKNSEVWYRLSMRYACGKTHGLNHNGCRLAIINP